jgi:acyl phosphate:glycerol-3-phosphate acyltransferase
MTAMTGGSLIVIAYLLGSVPIGFLLGYFSGVDVRRAGSGNVGATNVARVVGRRQGLITLLADVLKGFLPVALALWLGAGETLTSLAGLAAFLGHIFPVFLRFQGGKGVATALGVFLALAPWATAAMVGVFVVVAVLSRMVSLASMAASASAPVFLWLFSYSPYAIGLGLLLATIIILRHHENVRRLLAGVEPTFKLSSR